MHFSEYLGGEAAVRVAALLAFLAVLGVGILANSAGAKHTSHGVKANSIGAAKLKPPLRNRLSRPPKGGWFNGEDDVVSLPDAERTTVGTLDLGRGPHVITANVTVSGGVDNDNLLCFLSDGEDDLAAGNARALRESFGLTAIAESGAVNLDCQAGAGGTATDISITSVRVR